MFAINGSTFFLTFLILHSLRRIDGSPVHDRLSSWLCCTVLNILSTLYSIKLFRMY
jgi:hypothetical protein